MLFKTDMINNHELMIGNVRTIREEDGMLTFFPQDSQQCVIYLDDVIVMKCLKPTLDIRCTMGGMKILK